MINFKSNIFSTQLTNLLIVMLLVSCASREVKFPTNRFSTSETKGALLKTGFEFARGGAYAVSMTDEYNPQPAGSTDVDFSTGTAAKSSRFAAMLATGILPMMDFELDLSARSLLSGGLKFQLIGDHENAAKAWNFSLAVRAGGGVMSNYVTNDTHRYRLEAVQYYYDILAGIRILDNLLLYGGYLVNGYDLSIKYDIGSSQSGSGIGDQRGFHVGVSYNFGAAHIKINVSQVAHDYDTNSVSVKNTFYGVGFGYTL